MQGTSRWVWAPMDSILLTTRVACIAPGPCLYCRTTSPPWLCTKQRYLHMSILIQGLKQSGVDMHLYLGLLKEELATLWETPAHTWDAYTKEYFPLRAALLMTVQDYP